MNSKFIKEVIDGMYDWVRVIDPSDNVVFMNKAMSNTVCGTFPGTKCYEALRRGQPCENCISRKALFDNRVHLKEEIINGRTYSVMSSPIQNEDGAAIAVVEVLRDITDISRMQQQILQQNKKLQKDLDIARTLQRSLLPSKSPDGPLSFSYIYEPCESIGGDFLDIFEIDASHTGMYIADVSGHGVAASMLTIFLKSSLDKTLTSPAQALQKLYADFNRSGFDPTLYITVFYTIINTRTGSIRYTNAGHNVPPVLFNNTTSRFELLRIPGVPVSNWVDNPSYTEGTLSLHPGDQLFYYTDGVIELRNSENEQFGEERLLNTLFDERFSHRQDILQLLLQKSMDYAGIQNPSALCDDITMALLQWK